MAQALLAVTIAAALIVSHGVGAKRGCAAFGHSCFGGHGKRSSDAGAMDVSSPEVMARRQLGQEETPPHPGYPRAGYPQAGYGALQPGDDIIPVRDGGALDREDSAREVMKLKLRNIFKHWMDNYRRSQQNPEDGFYVESM